MNFSPSRYKELSKLNNFDTNSNMESSDTPRMRQSDQIAYEDIKEKLSLRIRNQMRNKYTDKRSTPDRRSTRSNFNKKKGVTWEDQ